MTHRLPTLLDPREVRTWAQQLTRQLEVDIKNLEPIIGEVTLTAGVTATTITAVGVIAESTVLLSPLTANAAAALGTTYVSSRSLGQFILTHANNAQTDRTFAYAAVSD